MPIPRIETEHKVDTNASVDVFTAEALKRLQHDINNRLYRITLGVDLLKMGISQHSHAEIFEEIDRSVADIRVLLKRSLSSTVTLKKEANNLINCCKENLSPGFLNLLAQKNIQLSLKFPHTVIPRVRTDRVFLGFALENILMNALCALEKVEGEKESKLKLSKMIIGLI